MHFRAAAFSAVIFIATVCSADLVYSQESAQSDYMTHELRLRVQELKRRISNVATDASTIQARTDVLWDWANAYAMKGREVPVSPPLPVNLPFTVAAIRSDLDTSNKQRTKDFCELLDSYIRQLTIFDEQPDALGPLTGDRTGPFEAGSYQTIRVEYELGSMPLKEGGGILVARHFLSDHGAVQAADPNADNYISIASSNSKASFKAETMPLSGMHGGFRSTSDQLIFRLIGTDLKQGDTLTITYGDTTSGQSRGFQVQTYSNDAFQLPLYVEFDHGGDLFMLPLVAYQVTGKSASGVHGFAPSVITVGEKFEVSVRTEDEFRNRATGLIPAYEVFLNEQPLRKIPAGDAAITVLKDLVMDQPGVYRLEIRSADGKITGVANPIWVQENVRNRIYWGDTHGHCGFAEGQGTPDSFFLFGREDARLDFLTLSEHDIWMDDWEWQALKSNVRKFNQEGAFIAMLGYEWTARDHLGGHHNVFFRTTENRLRVPLQEATRLSELYRRLASENNLEDVLIIPHAHQPGDARHSHPHMETLVEIMSLHGRFEWFGRMYLRHGHQVGFVAASDDHMSHPGYASAHLGDQSGLTAVLAPQKTTNALFDSMKSLAAYATSGERIILDVNLNGATIGQRTDYTADRRISARVIGTAPLDEVTIVKNGEDVWTKDYLTETDASSKRDTPSRFMLSFSSPTDPGIIDIPRGARPWIGNVTVRNASVASVAAPAFNNPRFDSVDRDKENGNRVHFRTMTRGGEKALVLELDDVTSLTEISVSLEATREKTTAPATYRELAVLPAQEFVFRIVDLEDGRSERRLQVDRHTDRVALRRIVSKSPLDVEIDYLDASASEPGDYYYLRVQQLDGGMAWSSPIWVGGYSVK